MHSNIKTMWVIFGGTLIVSITLVLLGLTLAAIVILLFGGLASLERALRWVNESKTALEKFIALTAAILCITPALSLTAVYTLGNVYEML